MKPFTMPRAMALPAPGMAPAAIMDAAAPAAWVLTRDIISSPVTEMPLLAAAATTASTVPRSAPAFFGFLAIVSLSFWSFIYFFDAALLAFFSISLACSLATSLA